MGLMWVDFIKLNTPFCDLWTDSRAFASAPESGCLLGVAGLARPCKGVFWREALSRCSWDGGALAQALRPFALAAFWSWTFFDGERQAPPPARPQCPSWVQLQLRNE